MNKTVKIVLSIFGALILLGGLGTWYATSKLDTAQLTQLLSSSVKSATGRDLKIEGPVSLSLFPRIAVSAERVSLSNAPWAAESEMVGLKRIDLDIETWPLLSGHVEIRSIRLAGLNLYLQQNAAGKSNWDMGGGIPASPSAGGLANQGGSGNGSLISLEKISVNDALLQYQDAQGQISRYQVQNLSITESGNSAAIALTMKYRQIAVDATGKTGSISKLMKNWDVSPAQFPLDLNVGINGKSVLLKGNLSKTPQSPVEFDVAVTSKSIDWPSASPDLPLQTADSQTQAKARKNPSTKQAQSPYLFSNDILPFDAMPQAKGVITLDIAELGLPARQPIQNLKLKAQIDQGSIDIPRLTFQLGKGQADMQLSITQRNQRTPVIAGRGVTKDLTLESLLARLDPASKVSGGNMKLAFDLKATGKSMHQLAASSHGKIQLSIDRASMGSNFLNDAGDFVITVLDTINPLRKKSQGTTLECAVAYLPISNGQVNIANTIGAQTDRLNVVMAGSINLNTEAVNLSIEPHEKSGLTTGVDLAGLVKMGGTLTNPKITLNQAGVVNSAVSIGLGILTSGASILAENARSMTNRGNPCRDALHPWSEIYPGAQ